ncbi:Uracil-DNA glycosylase [Rubrivivax sp. A210]|uniref:uracil-DNA glycosylase n=1 Tax=Rubrivivax sp. A210 TaxID=2772301 RepID=UPI00191B5390|nr:uracil-DNA glycosylase [Rubrivivax sp. A210]CAD5374934.1 Uracil-DNA glycosylase [Rubrivivax sp. A210]
MNRLAQPLAGLVDGVANDWAPLLRAWAAGATGRALINAVDARVVAGAVVYPAQVFRALELTPLADTRVVILGQDPYHGAGQAEGLAFSVPAGQRIPPSLRNIFKELQRDLGQATPAGGSLAAWAGRGVLLLNRSLTVEDGQPASHAQLGWQGLADALCDALARDARPKVFLLWGAHAQALAPRLQGGPHAVLQCNHPSPLSALRTPAPFLGCGHFGAASRFLAQAGRGAVDWALP